MGQQQLLLLVLATVIVGLATVAGIQAFDENQQQAEQDAVTSRALAIGSDVYSALQKPSQLGGVDVTASTSRIAAAAGYDGDSGIPLDGVSSSNADCDISSNDPVEITCSSDGNNTSSSSNEVVVVEVGANTQPSIISINGQSLTG